MTLPEIAPEPQPSKGIAVFRHPRSLIVSIFTGLSRTGTIGLQLWRVTLSVLVMKVTAAEGSFLVTPITLLGIFARGSGWWITDVIGHYCPAGMLCCALAAATISLSGCLCFT